MTDKSKKPLWGLIYPDLMDADKVIAAYREGKTQAGAAAIIGCGERTFRNALRFHNINPPFLTPTENRHAVPKNNRI